MFSIRSSVKITRQSVHSVATVILHETTEWRWHIGSCLGSLKLLETLIRKKGEVGGPCGHCYTLVGARRGRETFFSLCLFDFFFMFKRRCKGKTAFRQTQSLGRSTLRREPFQRDNTSHVQATSVVTRGVKYWVQRKIKTKRNFKILKRKEEDQ